jgi:nifR3 family TIM-barrel protein
MAGYTDTAFRTLCHRLDAGILYTEVTSAQAIVRDSKSTLYMLEAEPSEHPLAAHIYGSTPEVFARAAIAVHAMNRFDFIDINTGCPVRKVVSKGSGAALLKDPALIGRIVRAVREAVPLPVTVKTRSGFCGESVNVSEIAHAVEDAGGAAIAIHARVATRKHSGPADWSVLARVKAERKIPVLGNGGVDCAEDALRMIAATGVDGVMIGRGAIGNPWIFRDIRRLSEGLPIQPPSPAELKAVIVEHLDALRLYKARHPKYAGKRFRIPPDDAAALHFRGHIFQYLSGFRAWPSVRRRLNTLNSIPAILEAVDWLQAREDESICGRHDQP